MVGAGGVAADGARPKSGSHRAQRSAYTLGAVQCDGAAGGGGGGGGGAGGEVGALECGWRVNNQAARTPYIAPPYRSCLFHQYTSSAGGRN